MFLRYFFAKAGPFSGFDKSGKHQKLLDRFCILFPNGIPKKGEKWRPSENSTSGDYASLMDDSVRRTPPDCVESRWYTCDVASFYYYALWRFDILEYAVPKNASLEWWPGLEQDVESDDVEEVKAEAQRRTKSVIDFVRSDRCGEELLKCCICSIPRWEYARSLASKFKSDDEDYGVIKAMRSIFEATKQILGLKYPQSC